LNTAATIAQAIVDGAVDVFNGVIAGIQSTILALGINIGQDDPTQRSNLVTFLRDPLGFILTLIFDHLLIMLEWALAYAIGTVNEDLPPRPDWSGAGAGGVIVPGSGPPPTASGLASPLVSLKVSGYIFRTGHPGIDLALTVGTPVYTMHSGRILFSGWDSLNYGLTVIIQGGEWWTRYAHLSQITVGVGQNVQQGQVIGLGGSTGNSTGPHLHLEIKHNGRFIDPLSVL
jgi:murein DD-endopeptidase MepM/ murein hydrolase activator NlpD